MNLRRLIHLLACLGLGMGSLSAAAPAETNSAPATPKLSQQEFVEKLKELSPEERQAAIRAYREQMVREAQERPRVRQRGADLPQPTPEETEARQKQMRARLEARVADLQKKKAEGTLTPLEETQLEKMEAMLKQGPGAFSGDARRRELRPPTPRPKAAASQTHSPPPSPAVPPEPKPQ
jgi:hypothetical protein